MLTLESNTGRRSIKTLGVQNDRVTVSKSKERRKEDALKGMHFEVKKGWNCAGTVKRIGSKER
jgi:ribosomal protein L32